MDNVDVLFDRLAGIITVYIEDFLLQARLNKKNNQNEIKSVIDDDIMMEIVKSVSQDQIENIWNHQIANCKNINNLPMYLQKLVVQFLPKFFDLYPEYKKEECLKINGG